MANINTLLNNLETTHNLMDDFLEIYSRSLKSFDFRNMKAKLTTRQCPILMLPLLGSGSWPGIGSKETKQSWSYPVKTEAWKCISQLFWAIPTTCTSLLPSILLLHLPLLSRGNHPPICVGKSAEGRQLKKPLLVYIPSQNLTKIQLKTICRYSEQVF